MANLSKTNAMRILDTVGIRYDQYAYDCGGEFMDGVSVARLIGKPEEQVFKTLVTQGAGRDYYVFVLPVAAELDLKAAARAAGVKSVAMIKVTDIEKVTGYIRGGCSPVGMKKDYKTFIDSDCEMLDTVIVSGGKRGCQIELAVVDLVRITQAGVAKLTHTV